MVRFKCDEVHVELSKVLKEILAKTDRKDIAALCVESKTTRNAAENFLKNYKRSYGKDSSYAVLKKEEGNKRYKEKKYQESLDLYTESIFYCKKGDECLPLAYSNRALVLQHLGRPLQSLMDIDIALENGYPKSKSDLLILRKAKCLVQLGDIERAREVLNQALRNSEKNEFSPLFQKELEEIKDLKSKKNSADEEKLPELAGGENKNFVSASKYLSVYYDEIRGRHVLATEDIEAGDVLFVEKPFAFVLLEKGCHNCCSDAYAPIPCWNCVDVSYCSPKCRDEFWESVHSFECGFAKFFKSLGIAHLSVRIILKASSNLNELKNILKDISEPEYETGSLSYERKGYDSVYNLVHNFNKYNREDLFQYAVTALIISLYLKNYTNYFPARSGDADLRLLTSVIWRHILQLVCNGHGISKIKSNEKQGEPVVDVHEKIIGTGIYPSASMMNHSCQPLVNSSFHNNCLIVRAVKRIRKGEEVLYCYGPGAVRMKRAERQEILSSQYFFNCKCQACTEEIDIQDKFTAFKCTSCKGPSITLGENSQSTNCLDCGKLYNNSAELLNKQRQFYSLMEEGGVLFNDNVAAALKTYLECWWLGREIFYKFHKDLSYTADVIARCLAILKDFRRSMLFLKCSVRSVEECFGSCSIECAEEMKKLADIIFCYCTTSEQNATRDLINQAVSYYQRAQRTITIFYGPEFEGHEQIKSNLGVLEIMLKRK